MEQGTDDFCIEKNVNFTADKREEEQKTITENVSLHLRTFKIQNINRQL
jgi:hypothetical protein